MSEARTRRTGQDPLDFIEALEHPVRRVDGLVLLEMMENTSGQSPVMWGSTIVGFGSYHYRYPTGAKVTPQPSDFPPARHRSRFMA